jgi:hypothetical protein
VQTVRLPARPPPLPMLAPPLLLPRSAAVPRADALASVARALYAAVALAYVAVLLSAEHAYLLDLPYWVYEGAAVRAKWLGEPGAAATAAYPLKDYPVPNSLVQLVLALAVGPLGAAGAGKLAAVGVLLAGFASVYALCVRQWGRDGVYRALVLGATLVASAAYWNGYLNFQLGLAALALYGAVRARRGWDVRPHPALTLVAGVGLFACHFVPFFAFAVGAGLEALARRDGRSVAALLPAAALSAWYVLAKGAGDAVVGEGFGDAQTFVLYKGYTALKLGPFAHFLHFDGTGHLDRAPWLYEALLVGAAAFVAVLGVSVVRGAWMLRRATRAEARARWAVALLALGLALLAVPIPPVWLSVVNLGERLLAVALLLLVAVVPLPRRALLALAAATLPFFAYSLGFLADLPAPRPDVLEADYAARAAAFADGRPASDFSNYLAGRTEGGAARFTLLARNPTAQAAYYLALERGRWDLPLPSTGLVEGTDP